MDKNKQKIACRRRTYVCWRKRMFNLLTPHAVKPIMLPNFPQNGRKVTLKQMINGTVVRSFKLKRINF